MFKNIDFHFDNNTSRDQLFVSNDNQMHEKTKTNIIDKIRLTDNILMNKGNDNSHSILDNNQFNDFLNNKKKIENTEEKNIYFIDHNPKRSSLLNKIDENIIIKHNSSLKKKRHSSFMSLNTKEPLFFLNYLANNYLSIYDKSLIKIKYCDILLSFLTIISFLIILIDNQIYSYKSLDYFNEKINNKERNISIEDLKQLKNRKITKNENILRLINIIIAMISILILIIKYNYQLNLEKKVEKIPDNQSLFSSKFFLYLLLECLICLFIHPPYLNIMFYRTSTDNIYVFSLNSVLFLFHILKLYNILRLIRAFSKYNSIISKIICETYKIESGISFIIKSELNNRRLKIIISLLIFISLLISILIKDFECFSFNKKTMLYSKKGLNDLSNFLNTYWLTFVTITSVSYGDEYPRTSFGRLLLFISSFFGLLTLGLIIATLSEKILFNPSEKKAYLKLKRIFNQDNKLNKAANLIKTLLFLVRNHKNKNKENNQSILKEKICLLLKLRAESKLFKNDLHVSRIYEMSIDNFVHSMENKLYYNLIDITDHLEKIDSIEKDFTIIKSNQAFISNKLKYIVDLQNNINKYLIEFHNYNLLLKIKNKSDDNENDKTSSLYNISIISNNESDNNSNHLKINTKDNSGFLTPRYQYNNSKQMSVKKRKDKTKIYSELKQNEMLKNLDKVFKKTNLKKNIPIKRMKIRNHTISKHNSQNKRKKFLNSNLENYINHKRNKSKPEISPLFKFSKIDYQKKDFNIVISNYNK